MDLTALWSREKARIAAEVEATQEGFKVKQELESKRFIDSKSTDSVVGAAIPSVTLARNLSKSTATLCTSENDARDQVFRLFIDSSVPSFSTILPPHLSSQNEFAMEYATRATRRMVSPTNVHEFSIPSALVHNTSGQSSIVVRTKSSRTSRHPPPPAPAITIAQCLPTTTLAQIATRKHGQKGEYLTQTFKPYKGDVFGTHGNYIDGMVYMSRMKRSYHAMVCSSSNNKDNASDRPWMKVARRSASRDSVSDALVVARGNNEGKFRHSIASRRTSVSNFIAYSNDDNPTIKRMHCTQQQRCSLTLSNWSFNPENARLLVEEKGVEALIRLCANEDKTTRLHCVTALMNLSHVCEVRSVIVQQGAVKTICEIVNDMDDPSILTACAITLCNLCFLHGHEEILVDHGALSALSILSTEHEKVALICRCALFNLTCVSQSYHKIENVLKALLSLSSTSLSTGIAGRREVEYDEITAKGLFNLSNLKRIRLRLVEEGIVNCIPTLLHPTSPSIQELVARILLNLSRLATCRSELVAKGCMGTLMTLANASTVLTTRCCMSNILRYLSQDPNNVLRMVHEGLVDLIDQLCAMEEPEIFLHCARTLYNVSCYDEARPKLVARAAVATLSSISNRSSGQVHQLCTLTLCNLLTVRKAASDIVTAGAITAVIRLSMASDQTVETRHLFSKALHELCDKRATRSAAVDAHIVPALLYLSSIEMDSEQGSSSTTLASDIRARCIVALTCLAADSRTAPFVCNAAVVQCVTSVLTLEHSNVIVERFCCSCLSFLCRTEECAQLIVKGGATIERVLTTCMDTNDQESKASCCHVLASVSSHPSCCYALVRGDVISMLATLATIKENALIQRCCSITLANLTVQPTIRATLASAGVVHIVTIVSNSYSEESQRDCAKVLCNLSCIQGTEMALVQAGAVNVLMMISMVRAVSVRTKETCVRALLNLLNVDTMKSMVDEGLVQLLAAFATLASAQLPMLLTTLFAKLSENPIGQKALCADKSALSALFHLMTYNEVTDEERQLVRLHVTLVCTLVHSKNLRLLSVNAGLLPALDRIAAYEIQYRATREHEQHECVEKKLALVYFTLAKSNDCRMKLTSSLKVQHISTLLTLHSARIDCDGSKCVLYAIATLCWLTWHENTRACLQVSDYLGALMQMLQIQSNRDTLVFYSLEAMTILTLTLCCMAQSREAIEIMLKQNIVTCLIGFLTLQLAKAQKSDCLAIATFVALVSFLFRQLSHVPEAHLPLLDLFCTLVPLLKTTHDLHSALDCAEALCNIVFVEQQDAKGHFSTPSVARLKIWHLFIERKVLAAIELLLSDEQLPETRWRACATLWALTSVAEYRIKLVDLGVTRMLVTESYRAAKVASFETLECCAGALCNLTIVPKEMNSVNMVAEGAIPALIQLAKLEKKNIQEYCTVALSNLSRPSPKIDSGTVSALLHMSLLALETSATLNDARQHQVAELKRPPFLCNERHKEIGALPDYAIELPIDEVLDELKFETQLEVSLPPAPCVPLLTNGDHIANDVSKLMESTTDDDVIETVIYEKVNPEDSFASLTEVTEQEDDNTLLSSQLIENQEQSLQLSGRLTNATEEMPAQLEILTSFKQANKSVRARQGPPCLLSPFSRIVAQRKDARKVPNGTARKGRKNGGVRHLAKINSSPSLQKCSLSDLNELVINLEYFSTQPMIRGGPTLSRLTSTSSLPSHLSTNDEVSVDTLGADSTGRLDSVCISQKCHLDDAKNISISRNATQEKKLRAAKSRKKKELEVSSTVYLEKLVAEPKVLSPAAIIEDF